ncbi:MAG: CTP synthase [Candidatus Dependentiae bacterium]|nr:CTP synthase [Candidatus Dependentiae bacterium]
MTKFIVVTGGVLSGVGKGVTTASLGKILKEHGYKTTLIKIDPYINFDAGTLRPTEHGEVWVTDDGGEIDQDLGTYERFMDESIPKKNNLTTGQIYKAVMDKERAGFYLGQTVQFVPHIIDEIKKRLKEAACDHEIAIVEVGGTVGDYENVPFLLALKGLDREMGAQSTAYVLVTYLPIPDHIGEMKTKPTQQAIRLLGQEGILPDFIICRAKYPLDAVRRKKIEEFANISSDHVISAPDIETIYQIPLDLEREGLGVKVLAHLGLTSRKQPNLTQWQELVTAIKSPERRVTVAIVGKYLESGDFSMTDSYVSIYQALIHAGAQQNCGITINWIDAKTFETDPSKLSELAAADGVIIPGGFGTAGVEGKMKAIEYVRINKIPYLGLCYGMQLAAVEFARNVCGFSQANTTEVDKDTLHPIIDILPTQKQLLESSDYGGTMRLGSYSAVVKKESSVEHLYQGASVIKDGQTFVSERHRHRYEVNPRYVPALEDKGLSFSGYHVREDGAKLMEFLELPEHPFFIATQAHPEFKSRLGNPNPLFAGFVKACSVKR